LNGSEIIRRNLPWGFAAGAGTPASTKIDTVETITIPASLLQTGTNVLAVELHQNEEDLSNGLFDLGLTATACGCRIQEDDLPASQGTYIKLGSSTVRGSESTIEMDGGSGAKSGLIQFDLSSLPSGAGILHAELVVHVDDGSGSSSDDPYAIHALLRSWDESTAIWTSPWDVDGAVGANDSSPEKLGLMPIDPGTNVEVSAPLNLAGRSVVQGWLDTPATNFGFLLDAEPGSTDGLDLRADGEPGAPRLRVVYSAPSCQ
ncbi:DNRLRE domain-containing protein, partial [bacterium]